MSLQSIRSTDFWLHRRPTPDIAISATTSLTTSSCDAPFKILLSILGYWTSSIRGLFEVGTPTRPPRRWLCQTPCSHAGRSRCLYTSCDQDHDSVFFSFWSIKPAMLSASMLGDYSTSASVMPSCFPYRTDKLGNPFLITSLLNLLSFPFLFWIIIPAILPAMMLEYYSMSASSIPSEFFHRHFDLLEVCFL
jgi:hypothetical protein